MTSTRTINSLTVVVAQPSDLSKYIDLLEETAAWLGAREVGQIPPGTYRTFAIYYRESIAAGEVYFGVVDQTIVGTFRLLYDDGAVWPDADDDALCLENLAVRRKWSGHGVGRQLLSWAEQHVASIGKTYIRLDCFANIPCCGSTTKTLAMKGAVRSRQAFRSGFYACSGIRRSFCSGQCSYRLV